MLRLDFEPVDTLFFRDGRPFNQGEGNGGVESLFPPSPTTMVGAARVAWARALGWKGRGKWKDTIGTDLGGDERQLKQLRFVGPLLIFNGEPVFPAPALLIGKIDESDCPVSLLRLKPGPAMHSDLGKDIRLPVPDAPEDDDIQGRKLLSGWWIDRHGLADVLKGGVPKSASFIHQQSLWRNEPKVGNAIDRSTGTVEEGMLYSTQHIRLHENARIALWMEAENELAVKLKNFPDETCIPLGGEARSCWLSRENGEPDLPALSTGRHNGGIRYAIHVLTPLALANPPKPGESVAGLPGNLVSACLPRAQLWGGWNSNDFEPLPLKPHLPPGSVLFMEAEASEKDAIEKWHGKNIGERNSWGFGLIAIGQW